MKHLFLRRFLPALLCLVLALSLTACGGKEDNTTKGGDEGTKGIISGGKGGKGGKGNVSASKVDPKQAAESLALLQGGLIYSDQTTGAVAYLGQRERRDRSPMTDWLLENCGDLASALPFLLDIPAERVLGAGYGNLYCIVPRDENTSLAVNHITWEAYGNGLHPEADEVLYREEYAQPVLVFVDADEPDIEIVLVTNEGVSLEWIPQIDEYEIPIIPIGDDGEAMLMDFAIFGYTTGLDYGDDWDLENWGPNDGNWEPAGDDWWLPPTDAGLENTTWICDCWMMELTADDSEAGYAGSAYVYFQPQEYQEYELVRAGVWRMEDDCLRLKLTAPVVDGDVDAAFPILIAPSGEEMHFQRARTGEGMPFLLSGADSVELTRSYG